MKRLSSDLRLQPENLHQWHLQFPFEQKYLWIDKIWQGPFLLFSSAHFLTNYVKLFNYRKIEDDCSCIVGTVSQIYVVINRVSTIIVDLWSLFRGGGGDVRAHPSHPHPLPTGLRRNFTLSLL